MAGRPREFDRDEALAKARDAFWKRGYEGISMSDLVSILGLASSRIYAAFGSKEDLFRETVSLYRNSEGGAPVRALRAASTLREGIEAMLRAAIVTYTQPGRPRGCMVVTAATNCSSENDAVMKWLAECRRDRNRAILERVSAAAADGELVGQADVQALADHFGAVMSGLSVQARDGLSRDRLLALIPAAIAALEPFLRKSRPPHSH
jgi:AcrR family transcriptional regulator